MRSSRRRTIRHGPTDLLYGDRFLFGSSGLAAGAGYPIVQVPASMVFGAPLGISFFGTAFSEPTLIRLASGFEAVTRVRAQNPPTFALMLPDDHVDGTTLEEAARRKESARKAAEGPAAGNEVVATEAHVAAGRRRASQSGRDSGALVCHAARSSGRPTTSAFWSGPFMSSKEGSASTPSESTSLVQNARAAAAAAMSKTSASVKPCRLSSSTSRAVTAVGVARDLAAERHHRGLRGDQRCRATRPAPSPGRLPSEKNAVSALPCASEHSVLRRVCAAANVMSSKRRLSMWRLMPACSCAHSAHDLRAMAEHLARSSARSPRSVCWRSYIARTSSSMSASVNRIDECHDLLLPSDGVVTDLNVFAVVGVVAGRAPRAKLAPVDRRDSAADCRASTVDGSGAYSALYAGLKKNGALKRSASAFDEPAMQRARCSDRSTTPARCRRC